jgi:hypothetical protein
VEVENALSSNPIRCGWSSSFTHRTVEPAFTVIFAGMNVFLTMAMVLSDTEAVRSGVTMVAGRIVVITVDGFVGAIVRVTAGCAGGDSEHPEVRMRRRVIRRSTGIDFIDAGRSFPYNKMMAHLISLASRPVSRRRTVLLSAGYT